MKGLSLINKLLYLINSLSLFTLLLSYLSPFINPTIFWPISFIGLMFPILYITNLLFMIYWLIGMKRGAKSMPKSIFINVRWSTSNTLSDTLKNLEGLKVKQILKLQDIDNVEDLMKLQS